MSFEAVRISVYARPTEFAVAELPTICRPHGAKKGCLINSEWRKHRRRWYGNTVFGREGCMVHVEPLAQAPFGQCS